VLARQMPRPVIRLQTQSLGARRLDVLSDQAGELPA
jgi:hypothetical protein